MAAFIDDYVLEGSCERLAEGNEIHACAGQPADFAAATGANSLGSVAVTPGLGNGDFTVADGDVSGRKVTVAGQDIPITTATGTETADHVAVVDTANSRLLGVYVSTAKAVANGDTYQMQTFDGFENEDAA